MSIDLTKVIREFQEECVEAFTKSEELQIKIESSVSYKIGRSIGAIIGLLLKYYDRFKSGLSDAMEYYRE